jgi:hypothetical protein
MAHDIRWVRSHGCTVKYDQGQQILMNKLSVTKADRALRQHSRTARVGVVPDRFWSASPLPIYREIDSQITIYTQSLPTWAPYPDSALAGTSTLQLHGSATTHFLYSRRIAISSPKHYAQAEYSHASSGEHVGRAIASQSGRLPYTAEHGTREMRSYTLRALRMWLK